jgi:hypothetical protein
VTGAGGYRIERSPSSRARCRSCGRAISRGSLRFGVPHERPSGLTHLWHHLACAAAHRRGEVEAAEAAGAVPEGLSPLPLDELSVRARPIEQDAPEPTRIPRVEVSELDDARCARCGAAIARGALRVVLARHVEYRGAPRSSPIGVHPTCAAAAMRAEDCAVSARGFSEAVRANSGELPTGELDAALRAVGPIA